MNKQQLKVVGSCNVIYALLIILCVFWIGCSNLSAFAQSQVKASSPSDAALLNAIHTDHDTSALAMIEHGANINAKDWRGSTALMYAVDGPHFAVLKLLLHKGARVNVHSKDGDNALLWTIDGSSHLMNLKLLLEYGADVNTRDAYGQTPLMIAVNSHRLDLIEMLLRRHPSLDAKDEDGRTALDLAKLSLAEDYSNDDPAMNMTVKTIVHRLRSVGAKEHCVRGGK